MMNIYYAFWLQNVISERYPALYDIAMIYYISFQTSYLVERSFSTADQPRGKQKQSMSITD